MGKGCGFLTTTTYTPLEKKCNTWFRSPHDPSLGSATPRGQNVISRGSFSISNDQTDISLWALWYRMEPRFFKLPCVIFFQMGE